MATFTFNTLNELLAYLQTEIGPNGTQAITGQRHQDAVLTMAQSLVNIIASVPPSTVNQFPPYDADEVYGGGVEVVVRHANKLWLFVHASNQVGVTPGSNGLVWQGVSASELAHIRDRDQYLDFGGPNEVSASALRVLLTTPAASLWIAPVGARGVTSAADADAAGWTRVIVSATGATGVFSGQANKLAVKAGGDWTFLDAEIGSLVENLGTGNLLIRRSSEWREYNIAVPSLAQVMAVGATTSGTLAFGGATVRNAVVVNHNTAGTASVAMSNVAAVLIQVSADVVFGPTSIYGGGEWRITFRGISGGTIGFSSAVFFADGLTPPTSCAPGENIVMRCVGFNGGLLVESYARFTE